MFGEAGTQLGKAQMALIRIFMIWPLKAVAPAAFLFWGRELCMTLRSSPGVRPRAPPSTALQLLGAVGRWGSWQLLRLWLSLEVGFCMFYHWKRRQLEKQQANPPVLAVGQPHKMLLRIIGSINDIQAGGRLADSSPLMSPRLLTPHITPQSSAQDLQGFLQPRRVESSVEELLREWNTMNQSAHELYAPAAYTQHDREIVAQMLDEAEMVAMKRAEVSGWFLQRSGPRGARWPAARVHEIRRGNLEEWLAWAFFHCDPVDVPKDRRSELECLLEEGTKWLEADIPEGYNPEMQAMRLTMDPIPSEHRPLVSYVVTALLLPAITEHHLVNLGFRQYRSGTLRYWHRPGSAGSSTGAGNTAPPMVFCHGIGVNLLPYVPLLKEFMDNASSRTIFLVSLPHISMRIKEDVPSSAEMVACLSDMLASWDVPSAHFVGHSFGSLLLAWVARRAPHIMRCATFIDPVCFLLIKPDVCYNFMYREAETPTQLLLSWFVSKELYIAQSLSRNFFWYQNILWPEQLTMPSLVVLSGCDSIVPAHSVRRYLVAYKQQHPLDFLRVLWFPDLGHGEINFGPVGLAACHRLVKEMLKLEREALKQT